MEDDHDLTSGLQIRACAGTSSRTASREAAATNRAYELGQEIIGTVTFYDVETIDGARQFMAALNTLLQCPNSPASPVAAMLINIPTSTKCDELQVVRVHQPVSETIDAWCRVGNLLAWVRLDPTLATLTQAGSSTAEPPLVPPTDDQASQTLVVVGERLRAVFDATP